MSHAQIDPAKRPTKPPKPRPTGRPRVVIGGIPTSVYLPEEHIMKIEAHRRACGFRSTSEAHRDIIARWARSGEVEP